MLITVPHLLLITLDCKSPVLQLLSDSLCPSEPFLLGNNSSLTHMQLSSFSPHLKCLFSLLWFPSQPCASTYQPFQQSHGLCTLWTKRSQERSSSTPTSMHDHSKHGTVTKKWPLTTGNVVSLYHAGQMKFSCGG